MSDAVHAIELETIAGLHGCITRWRCLEPATGELLYPRDGDALLPLPFAERATVEAVLRSEVEQPVRLEVNGFSGWSAALNANSMVWQPLVPGWGNTFVGRLRQGENRLRVSVEPQEGPRLLGARVMGPDRTRLTGVQQVFPAPPDGLIGQLRRGLSPLGDFIRMANQPCALQFPPGTDWEAWHAALRAKLDELLQVPSAFPSPEDKLVGAGEEEGYRQERHLLTVDEHGTLVPYWLLVPESPNGATLLCLHGHGYTFGETVGVPGEPVAQQRELMRDHNYDYARQAARRGYIAVTPDFRGFGERNDYEPSPRDPCDAYLLRLSQYGTNVVALQLHDLRALINHLGSRPEVDLSRLGCLGLSYGGRMAMYAAATDTRIRVAVVSGALNSFKERLLRNQSCGAQFVPGLLQFADVPELLGLIAPRPLFLELGCRDDTSPELFASEIYQQVAQTYAAAHADGRLALEVFEWGHRFRGVECWPWIDEQLR